MKKFLIIAAALFTTSTITAQAFAQGQDTLRKNVTTATSTSAVPTFDVASILSANGDYATAAMAVKAAGLQTTLASPGPFTIFAPNNAAFSKLSSGALDSLMKNPAKLAILLKGHVVNGRYTKADIIKALTAGMGKATLTTLDNQTLTLSVSPNKTLQLTNAAGSSAEVTVYDIIGTNGVVNGLNGVLK